MGIFARVIREGAIVIALMLFGSMIMGLGGCAKPEPVTGGVTDLTDPDAPKKIESKEITSFRADVCLAGEWSPGREDAGYEFSVKTDADGTLIASESGTAISAPADVGFLAALQEIVDKYDLAAQNGVYRVTAGLPHLYRAASVTVNYASGERIAFTVNNDPYAEWAKDVYLLFADLFAANGDDTLLPPVNDLPVEGARVVVIADGIRTEYADIILVEGDGADGTPFLMKSVYDENAAESISEDYVPIPDDYGDRLTAILAKYDLRPFDNYSVLCGRGRTEGEPDASTSIYIYVEYQGARVLEIDTNESGDVAVLRPLTDDIAAYLDPLFAAGE